MAIGANAAVWFFGTEDTVTAGGGTSAVANAAYSAAADAAAWTHDDDSQNASFVLTFQYPSGTITTGGIQLFAQLINNNGTTGEPQPSTTWLGHFLGSFSTGTGMSAETNYALELGPVDLPLKKTSQEYKFYVLNSCGVTMTAGWTLKVTPMAVGPHA